MRLGLRGLALCWLGAGAALALLSGCGHEGQASPTRATQGQSSDRTASAIEVSVSEVVVGAMPRKVRITGTLHGQEETTVAAKVAGRIAGVFRDVADQALPGALLARVDQTDFILERDEKRLALAQALAELGIAELPPPLPAGEDVPNSASASVGGFDVHALPGVQRAKLQADNAYAKYQRGEQLYQQTPPLISDQDFADLRTAWEVAKADHRVAILTAEAKLAEARMLAAQLRIAEQRLKDTDHVVPHGIVRDARSEPFEMPGDATLEYVVTARLVSVGDMVQVGTPLFRLVDPDPVKLRAAVPERRAAEIRIGQLARAWTDAHPEPVIGRVSRVNPAVNPQTRTFDVEIILPNTDRGLNPGSFARADVEVRVDEHVMMVPRDAIVTFAGVTKVFTVQDGKAEDQIVTLGDVLEDKVEIVSGLSVGQTIIRRPPAALTSGMAVVVRPSSEASVEHAATGAGERSGGER